MGVNRPLVLIIALFIFLPLRAQGIEPSDEGLGNLYKLKDYRARRVSSYDRTGGNTDYISGIQPGQTVVLADLAGPGMIAHIWITTHGEHFLGRKLMLGMFWDDEEDPSVLCPLNDFFCSGHGLHAGINSIPIAVTSRGSSLNCFFKMPFNKRARIEITNEGLRCVKFFYYYIDYRTYNEPFEEAGYFHARYRQEYPAVSNRNYVICEAQGRGHFVGCNYSVESNGPGWWGEGDDRWFIDGESVPSMHGTGTEDFLCQAWGIELESLPYFGTTIHEGDYAKDNRYTSYRFYVQDPVPFEKSLKLEIEHYGGAYDQAGQQLAGMAERPDNISSVAYWYQVEPHKPWPAMAPIDERLPREAGKEITLLAFLRKAAELSSSASIESLRAEYNTLSVDPELASFHGDLLVGMAKAEAAAGNSDKARAMIKPFAEPFVKRYLATRIWSVLGKPDDKSGVKPLLVEWEDGSTTRVVKEGKTCVATNQDEKKPHIYFALPQDSDLRNSDRTVLIKVTYYSTGKADDTFRIHYDSFFPGDIPGSYHDSELITKSSKPGWYTAVIKCPRVRFAGRQNGGSDFRLSSLDDGDEFIADTIIILE